VRMEAVPHGEPWRVAEGGACTTWPPFEEADLSHSYPVPAGDAEFLETVRRSRFITYAGHAPSEEAARSFLDRIRRAHPGATHHCWAFNAGAPGSTAHVGMSDDGEPHGTAGRPMLNTLLHADVGETILVCVRYFGGTKLGTGGLMRAYTSGARGVLALLPTKPKVDRTPVSVRFPYPYVDVLERVVTAFDGLIDDREFSAEVTLRVSIPVDRMPEFREAVADATAGEAEIEAR